MSDPFTAEINLHDRNFKIITWAMKEYNVVISASPQSGYMLVEADDTDEVWMHAPSGHKWLTLTPIAEALIKRKNLRHLFVGGGHDGEIRDVPLEVFIDAKYYPPGVNYYYTPRRSIGGATVWAIDKLTDLEVASMLINQYHEHVMSQMGS